MCAERIREHLEEHGGLAPKQRQLAERRGAGSL
jgi:hypothetical protein